MTNPDLVNAKEFSRITGISYHYLSQVFQNSFGHKRLAATDPRFYYGVQLPYPIGGDFFKSRKKWLRSEVLKFKENLDVIKI